MSVFILTFVWHLGYQHDSRSTVKTQERFQKFEVAMLAERLPSLGDKNEQDSPPEDTDGWAKTQAMRRQLLPSKAKW